MKKFALLLLTALLALPASLYAQDPTFVISTNDSGEGNWSHKLVFNQGTDDEYALYVIYDKYVNARSCVPGYVEQYTGKDIFFPAQFEYNGEKKVMKGIDSFAYEGCQMNSITISEGIQWLAWGAFENCDSLTTVHIPSTVTDIGLSCFGKCDNLEKFTGNLVEADGRSIVIQRTETRRDEDDNEYEVTIYSLRAAALKGLTSYTVPLRVTHIETFFENMVELEEFIMPEGLVWVSNCSSSTGDYAIFENCGIKTLRIPDSLNPANTTLISNCPNLESFTGKWASEDGRYLRAPLIAGEDYWELTEEDYAEIDRMIEAGEMTEEEKEEGIAWCEAEANKYRNKYTVVAFASKGAGDTIEIPDDVAILYNSFHGCETLKNVVLPNSVVKIHGAFQGCKNIENLIVSNNLSEIGSKSFLGCEKLREFIAPATIYEIGQDIFRDCLSLERAVIPSQDISMNGRVFLNCPNLKYIELGATSLTDEWGPTIDKTTFAPGYVDEPTMWEADKIDTPEHYDLYRSDAVLVIPRGYGETYNNDFLDWNYMTKENLVEKDIPANVYIGIDSETGYNLFAKRVNAEATCNLTCDDPTQEIVTVTASETTSGEFNVQPQKVGATYVTVALEDSNSDDFSVSFASKITVVDMQTPTAVEFPQGSTYTIPDDDIVVEWPDGMPEGASLSYAIDDTTYVSLTDAEKGTMYAKPSAPAGSTATLTVTLKDPSGNTLVTREVDITVTQHEHQWAEGNDVKCDYCDTWKLKCVPNKLNSLVRPYPGIITDGIGSIYDFSGISGNSLYGEELEINEIEAGHPYIFKPMEGVDAIYFQATDTSTEETTAETVHGLHGVLSSEGETISATETNPVIVFTNNGLKYLRPGTPATIGFGRCYIDKDAAEDTPNLSSAKSKFIGIIENGETTGIDDVTSESAPDNTNSYNIMGGRVGETYKGIIINNGKKYIQK